MTDPPTRTRTVDDVAGPYANYLVPVPRAAPDTCSTCHSTVYDGYTLCYPCNQARRELGSGVADVTAFVSLAPAGEQFARELYTYKRETVPVDLRRPRTIGLAAVLWKWLNLHEGCLSTPLGAPSFDVITTVPSTAGRPGHHPLEDLVANVVVGAAHRCEDLLRVQRTELPARSQAPDRYVAARDLTGVRVLVIDDTWTTGAHAQSASCALKSAGASAIGVLCLGRWFDPNYRANSAWLTAKRKVGWQWTTCCIHPL